MARRCIFCGKEFGLFGGGLITCGDTDQPVCSDCSSLLSSLSPMERAEKVLETGRAVEPEALQKFLIREKSRREQETARIQQAHQAIRTDKTCLRCGGPMEKCGTKLFHLGDEGLLGPVAKTGCSPPGWRLRSSGVPSAARRSSTFPSPRSCLKWRRKWSPARSAAPATAP